MSRSDRGASEIVGFALVFAIIFAGVGAVYVGGSETLSTVHDRQQTAGAEEALIVLQHSLTDVRTADVRRTGTLAPGQGRLTVDPGPTVSVVENGTVQTFVSEGLSYRTADRRLSIASGGVFRGYEDRSIVAEDPEFVCRPAANVAIVTATAFQSNRAGIDVDSPFQVRFVPVSRTTWQPDRVSVNVSGASNRDAWRRYLSVDGWSSTGPSTYECPADEVIVRLTVVRVQFVT